MIAIKELLVKFGQVLEVIAWEAKAWEANTLGYCEVLLCRFCFGCFVAILKRAFL